MPGENGVPEEINLDFARQWVLPRLSEKRFKHVAGVVATARTLSHKAGVSTFLAELSGWLHDASKEIKDRDLVDLARKFQIPLDDILIKQGHLLHGPVASATVKAELGISNQEVLSAIAEHTLGAVPMAPLSQVLYLADCLEDSRPRHYTDPIWDALDLDGKFDMEAAIYVATNCGLKHLIESGRPIHPKTVEVRNYYLDIVNTRSSTR